MEPLVRRIEPGATVDVRLTLAIHRRGPGDPTLRYSRDGSTWRATRTPDGPATLRLIPDGDTILAQAWGPGAGWAIEQAPELLGADDDAAGFAALVAGHALLRDLHARFAGVRIGRTRRVLEALVPAIIEQKVTGDEARAAFVALVRRHGEPAPGPWDEPSGPPPGAAAPAAGARRRWPACPATPTTRSGSSGGGPTRSASRRRAPSAWRSARTCRWPRPTGACGPFRSWAPGRPPRWASARWVTRTR